MNEENKNKKLRAGFFFLSLGVVISLITTIASSLSLFFKVIDIAIPDSLNNFYSTEFYNYGALAILIIFFPALLVLNHFWQKIIKKGLSNTESVFLKWATYLILFLASLTIIIDLITLLNYFLSGEITLAFIYKVLATIIVAGLSLFYYQINLKMFELGYIKVKKRVTPKTGIKTTSIILFIILIIFTFQIIGSPNEQRLKRLDSTRVSDLQSIQMSVINYWQQKGNLPTGLSALKDPTTSYNIPSDPEAQSGKKYEYKVTGDKSFELCADFLTITNQNLKNENTYYVKQNESWQHKKGEYCFERRIDPDIYKPLNQ